MELKKSVKADLENKKGIFFQLGLIFALGLTLIALEYKSFKIQDLTTYGPAIANDIPEEMIQITEQSTPPPPPPPPTPSLVLNVVENTAVVRDDININAETNENTPVENNDFKPGSVSMADEESVDEKQIFMIVETAPMFPGGDDARRRYLIENMRYPQSAKEKGIHGTIYVTFVIERNGEVTDVKVLHGIGGGCDEEALRVVRNMPRWEPGRQRGKPVRVQFNMPIVFSLAN